MTNHPFDRLRTGLAKGLRRYRLWLAALGLVLALAALPQAWVMFAHRGSVAPGQDWPFLLGRELMAQVGAGGEITGTVQLQGQSDHSGVLVELDGGSQTSSDSAGAYAFENVSPGTHVLSFSFPKYLSQGVATSVDEGATTVVPPVLLVGGDVTGNGLIDLRDLVFIATRLNFSDPSADVNRDGSVNARDLVFGGRNFGKTARAASSSMEHRLRQLMRALRRGGPGAAEAALNDAMEILYGGMRPLPSMGDAFEQTRRAHEAISRKELELAQALEVFAHREDVKPELAGMALDLKLFIEEMNEAAEAVGMVTARCGQNMSLSQPPCDQLMPMLDERTGEPIPPTTGPQAQSHPVAPMIHPSYSVKLRSPLVPPWIASLEKDVVLTRPIARGECDTVFKEIQGLMVRLHFERMTVVRDPWVGVFSVPRGTAVPIWSFEWVPSEYVKTWRMCNRDGNVVTSVSQQVKQDHPLNFFWRFQAKDP